MPGSVGNGGRAVFAQRKKRGRSAVKRVTVGYCQTLKIAMGHKKTPGLRIAPGVLDKCLAVTYSRTANAALPSALARFTAEFGMGSGGSTPLLPPGKVNCAPAKKAGAR